MEEPMPQPPGRGKSRPSRPGAFSDYDKVGRVGGGGRGMGKIIIGVVLLLLVIVAFIVGVVLSVALKKSDAPIVKVQRLAIPRFDVDTAFVDEQVVLSADFDFYLETNNRNPMTTAKLESMLMEVNWNEYQAQLGQSTVESVTQGSGSSRTIKIRAHGASSVKKKTVTKQELKLDVVLSGSIVFSLGPFSSKSYAFMVTCPDVSISSKDTACSSKLYSSKKEMPSRAPPSASSKSPSSSSSAAALVDLDQEAAYWTPEPPPSVGSPTAQPSSEPAQPPTPTRSGTPVKLTTADNSVTVDNGILAVTVSKPDGHITGIKYNGVGNILDGINPEDDRGYWDVVWAPAGTKGTKGTFDRLKCTTFRVIVDTEDQIEVSFSRNYNPDAKDPKAVPLDIDLRYILLRGESGLYSYGILERQKWPGCTIPNARLAFKLFRTKFRNVVVADNRRRKMPLPEDRMKGRGQALQYPEAVQFVDPIDPEFKGEVDDKYQYSDESHDIQVHGYYSDDPPMGFWQITPSYEFRTGGPNKQFLTSHVGPSVLAMFVSAHYSGENVIPKFEDGEPWKKVLGPVFMYLNKADKGQNASLLWDDAKKKMEEEADAWPYSFPASDDFLKGYQRANVTGKLFVLDRFVDSKKIPASESYVGLSNPGKAGSWQLECKGYQFWTNTDSEGRFTIDNVRPGSYDLFGWVPGFIGDFRHKTTINITIGRNIDLGDIVYEPPRDGPTLWEIGEPERTAKEFFIPDPNPNYVNKLYVNHPDKFRQYGLWERYTELYSDKDMVYNVNGSDYKKDWFFAQVTRKVNDRYNGTTWQIKFKLENVDSGVYKLRVAVAGSTNSVLEIRVNEETGEVIFTAAEMGSDNCIARHGIHGLYWLFNVDVKAEKLKQGENTIYLKQTKGASPFQGIMYDYIRLEAPSSVAPKKLKR